MVAIARKSRSCSACFGKKPARCCRVARLFSTVFVRCHIWRLLDARRRSVCGPRRLRPSAMRAFMVASMEVSGRHTSARPKQHQKGANMARTNRRSFILGFCGLGLISIPGARVTLAASKISLDDKSVLIVVDVQTASFPEEASPSPMVTRLFRSSIGLRKRFQTWCLPRTGTLQDIFHLPRRIPAPSHSKRSNSRTVIRCCGQTIACRGPVQPIFRRTFPSPRPS